MTDSKMIGDREITFAAFAPAAPLDWEDFTISSPRGKVQGSMHPDAVIVPGSGDPQIPGSCKVDSGARQMMMIREVAEYVISVARDRRIRRAEARAQRQATIESIPGLTVLREALAAERNYADQFDRMMEDEANDGVNPPRRPSADPTVLSTQYIRAAAYLDAEAMSEAANYAKAAEGRKAMDEIISGAGPEALQAAQQRWAEYCEKAVD